MLAIEIGQYCTNQRTQKRRKEMVVDSTTNPNIILSTDMHSYQRHQSKIGICLYIYIYIYKSMRVTIESNLRLKVILGKGRQTR